MEQVKCECGHANPKGTEICQSCGKPFDNQSQGTLNMRYEGVARRSETYQRSFIDRVWKFFASVRVGIWLLVITLIASMLGTIYPQEMYIPATAIAEEYYPEEYGTLGYIYVQLGFHNLYSSWWYMLLLALIGISLIVASIDRGIPLYRSLKKQRVTRHRYFLQRQRLSGKVAVDDPKQVLTKAKESLQKQRYNTSEEERAIMGEKGRFSRWGAYVVHLGLIILLIGALLRIMPGMTQDDYVWVRDGETVPIPGTNGQYYLESEGFTLEVYDEDEQGQLVPEEFVTEAVLYENILNEETGESSLQEVKRKTIVVNDPLAYDRFKLYQSDYILNEFSEFSFDVVHKESEESLGNVAVDLYDPQSKYDLGGGNQVELIEYYPDFELDQNRQPTTTSNIPNNPAFIFEVTTPEKPEGERSWIFLGQTVEMPGAENEYALSIDDIEFSNVTGLMVRKELTLPMIYTGLGITMVGLVLCFYWQHRRIWIQQEGQEVWVAAHTNKNWYGLKKEVEKIIDDQELNIDKASLDKEE